MWDGDENTAPDRRTPPRKPTQTQPPTQPPAPPHRQTHPASRSLTHRRPAAQHRSSQCTSAHTHTHTHEHTLGSRSHSRSACCLCVVCRSHTHTPANAGPYADGQGHPGHAQATPLAGQDLASRMGTSPTVDSPPTPARAAHTPLPLRGPPVPASKAPPSRPRTAATPVPTLPGPVPPELPVLLTLA